MRRFRNWRSEHGVHPNQVVPRRPRFSSDAARPVRARGRAVSGISEEERGRRDQGQALRQDGPTDGRTVFLRPGGQGDEGAARSKSDPSKLGLARTCRCAGRMRGLSGVARWGVYNTKPLAEADGCLAVMHHIDELHSGLSVLRLTANDLRTRRGRPSGQPRDGAAADAGDGDRGAGSAGRHEQSRARAQGCTPSCCVGLKIVEPNAT